MLDTDGQKMMAFNCGGPSFLVTREMLMEDLGPRLAKLVRSLEVSMGRR